MMPADPPCTSCGLIHQQGQCRLQTSTTLSDVPIDITPARCFTCYLILVAILLVFAFFITVLCLSLDDHRSCYVEIFANSVSVSNANVSTADWTIGFVGRSPATGCNISIHTLNSRLLRGGEVISISSYPSSDSLRTGDDKTDAFFQKVVMPATVDGDVIWDLRVEIVLAMMTNATYLHGILTVACPAIPVKFTTDSTGKVIGSLLGNIRRCEYEFRQELA